MQDDDLNEPEEEIVVDDEIGEGESEEELSLPDEEPEEVERPQSRAERRIQSLANEKTAAEARASAAEAAREQAEAYARSLYEKQSKDEFEQLDPDEQWRRTMESQIKSGLAQTADNVDRSEFLMKVSANPSFAKHIPDVEKFLAEARRGGGNPTREQVLIYMLGQQQYAGMGNAKKASRAASARVSEARGSSPNVKSDVKPSSKGQSLLDKYGDIQC